MMKMMMMTMVMINVWLRMIDDLSMEAKFHDFAKRDGRTDIPAYWDAMDASKNAGQVYHFETFLLLSVMVKYFCYQLMSGALSRVW